jgi:hypothetical protein
VRVLLGLISAALLVVVFVAALIGEPSSAVNLAPTFVYVVFWLGVVVLQVLLGDVWSVLNPWLAIGSGVAWVWRRLGFTWDAPLAYPERLGVWPGAFLLFCFAALELCYAEPANPRALALAIALYSYAMWFGMAAVGRHTWTRGGDAFAVYFGLLAKLAPFGERDGRLVVRWPLTGLSGRLERPGMLAFVAVMLGSVAFDGISRSTIWQNLRARLEEPYILDAPNTAELVTTLLSLAGLTAAVLTVALAYRLAVWAAERLIDSDRSLVADFLPSLVPIAFVYAVAHYFTLLLIQGQFAIPLASDPFGRGWNLFGTIHYTPNLMPVSPNNVWYVQVGAIVAGHVAGLTVAHDRAVTIFPQREALRSQYAMLALMLLYTFTGLTLLWQG